MWEACHADAMRSYTLWERYVYVNYVDFFCMERLSLFSRLFIYSMAYLYQHDSGIFISYFGSQSSTILFIFLMKLLPFWPLGSSFSWCLGPFDILPHRRGVLWFVPFWALSYFLALQSAQGPSCIFPAWVLESAIFSRIPAPFSGERCEKRRSKCQVGSHCSWDAIAFRLSQLINACK